MSLSIECRDLWKSYHQRPQLGIKEILIRRKVQGSRRFARQWALREITFSVQQGVAFGIVGHNGTGKSTLLSLLLGTIIPDRGEVRVNGHVASLLEIGAGFHPELSGRENIYLYGSILGVTISDIRRQFDRIVEFSELDGAIDNPLRTYSSGMITRLGFSVIIHVPADVLLIDEILGVGDARFRLKCLDYLLDFNARGGTLLIVSHEMEMLERVCTAGMCLNEGVIAKIGTMPEAINYYRRNVVLEPANA